MLCEDLLLPPDPFHGTIVSSINEQIKQYQEAEELHPRTLFTGAGSTQPQPAMVAMVSDQPADPFKQPADPHLAAGERDPGDSNVGADEKLLEGEDGTWWDGWRKKVKLAQEVEVGQEIASIPWTDDVARDGQESVPQIQVQAPPQGGNDELRIVIQLDIAVDNLNLRDQFEWDVADTQNSPEDFASVYCADLGLPGEFR